MVEFQNIIYSQKRKERTGRRATNRYFAPHNIRLQVFVDAKHNDLLMDLANKSNLSISQAVFTVIEKYFILEKELTKWQQIAQAQMNVQKDLEKKLEEKSQDGDRNIDNNSRNS